MSSAIFTLGALAVLVAAGWIIDVLAHRPPPTRLQRLMTRQSSGQEAQNAARRLNARVLGGFFVGEPTVERPLVLLQAANSMARFSWRDRRDEQLHDL